MTKFPLIDMQTVIASINKDSLAQAKTIIENSGVVAIPTETVYGLGGNAFDDVAVKRIFDVKGRPNDNPLIAHVHTDYDISRLIDYDLPYAKQLREAFLPGPLTLVYPSTDKVSALVSCGLKTLAIRVPAHVGAQAFLKEVGVPIVAPSANISRHVSPTSAKHVFDDFNGKIPLILDGGECVGGIESTVCDCTGEYPVILRPGLITKADIARVVGRCEEYTPNVEKGEKVKSPGVLYKHYAPRCETLSFASVAVAVEQAENLQSQGVKVGALCEEKYVQAFEKLGVSALSLGATAEEMASRLYGLLREAETRFETLIVVIPTEKGGVMQGVLNRLQKACSSKDVPHN